MDVYNKNKDINTKHFYIECSANIRKFFVLLLCDIDAISRFFPGEQQFTGHVTEPYILYTHGDITIQFTCTAILHYMKSKAKIIAGIIGKA